LFDNTMIFCPYFTKKNGMLVLDSFVGGWPFA
jgi:hypothetical protein